MTLDAANLVGSQCRGLGAMKSDAHEALSPLVAGQAILVGILASVSDGFLPGP